MKNLKFRCRAFAWHLAFSCVAALVVWLIATQLWYPWPLATLAGGMQLFLIVIWVDLVLGPSLTAVIANPTKPRRELARDLAIIVGLQISALAYGVYTLAAARPVALAFEVDLFRLVSASEVEVEQLPQAPAELRTFSWSGPHTLAAIPPSDANEQYDTVQLGMAGIPLAALPKYWRPYASQQAIAWEKARPLRASELADPQTAKTIPQIAAAAGVPANALRALPLLARRAEGTVLLAPPDARIVGILPVALSP